jgi:hypothetical protein
MVVKRSLAALAFGCCGFAMAQTAAKPHSDTVMTREQGQKLLNSVDAVMAFDSEDTGLATVLNVKRRLVTRDEVTAYLIKNFEEDESAKRLQRSEIVLKKFGLLSQDFKLQPFLLKLLTEQVAGYYDEKTKTVNLLNWVPASVQEPVLAHELTHALQDKRVDLQTWSTDGYKGESKTVAEDNQRIHGDELETARQAVVEGQAMLVFVDYTAKHPDQQKDADASAADSSIMSRAPLLLQKSLEFPYVEGIAFEQALRVAGGKEVAFSGALDQPPTSSFEIFNPQAYLSHTPVPVLRLPDVHGLLDARWQPYDVGGMGELDVDMMASTFSGPAAAASLAPQWDGGLYYAAQRRTASPAEKQTSASIGVLYYSQWKSASAAQAFEQIYAAELPRKDSGVAERTQDEAVGEQVYSTREGDVLLALSGRTLFIAEGFSLADARKLRDAVAAVQSSGPMRMASGSPAPRLPELTLGLANAIAAHGLLRFALEQGRYTATRNSASTTR